MKTKLLFSVLAFLAMTTLVSAQNQGAGRRGQNAPDKGVAFVDSNNDGICDNFESRNPGNRQAGRKGNSNFRGNGQGKGMRQGKGSYRNFVDADKNGICDNRETTSEK